MSSNNQVINDYLNFDLLITRAGDAYRTYVIDAPGGDAATSFVLPFSPQTSVRLNGRNGDRRNLYTFADITRRSTSSLHELGSHLYDAVFRDRVRDVLVASQKEAENAQRHLRIRLRFSDDAIELAMLPWEILFDPAQQHFLALSASHPILRYLSLPRARPALVVKPPLCILVVLASPEDHHQLNVEQEWQAMETALAPLCADGKVSLEQLPSPTFAALQQRLLGEPIHILHFVGHGFYAAEHAEGTLLFENDHQGAELISAKALAMLLHNHSALRLVYLNACEGATADQGNVFAGIAQSLVQQGVPAAVAMQDEITDTAAIALSQTFYTALAAGLPVDAALTQARVALAARQSDEWAIPVLFSRSPDNRLFDVVDVLPTPDCPYPGLRSFSEEQADHFFGRNRESDEAINHLTQHPFLAVVGPSGSGKSSLVYAGIIPALKKSRRFGKGGWDVKIMRPSDSRTEDGKAAPLQALTHTLQLSRKELTDPPSMEGQASTGHLVRKTLLFVDQLEEVFTLADADEAVSFLTALHNLMGRPDLYILLTARADFYSEMMATGLLWEAIKANRLELTSLGDDELWSAIVQPAASVGVTVDEALAVALITDASGETGALPLVQETLVLLWEKVERREIKLKAYQAMAEGGRSGIQVAIDRRATMLYNNLPDDAKPIAQRIFLRLIQFGEGRADTRRQQTGTELRASREEAAVFDQTLHTLINSRLLTTSGQEGDSERRLDIAHEALIGGWRLLQRWIAEKRAAERTRRRLEEKADEWLHLAQNGGLLDAYEVQEAEAWLQSDFSQELGYSQNLVDLMTASKRALTQLTVNATRNRQRLHLLAGGLLLTILIVALVGWFWRQAEESAAQAQAAEQSAVAAKEEVDAVRLALVAKEMIAQDKELALLLAIEAARTYSDWTTDQALRAVLASPGYTQQILLPTATAQEPRVSDAEAQASEVSPDGRRLLVVSEQKDALAILDSVTQEIIWEDTTIENTVINAQWSPSGSYIYDYDNFFEKTEEKPSDILRVWSATDGSEVIRYQNQNPHYRIAWRNDDAFFVIFGDEGAQLWHAAEGRMIAQTPSYSVQTAEWSPADKQLLLVTEEPNIAGETFRLFTIPEMAEFATFSGSIARIMQPWSAQGNRILYKTGDIDEIDSTWRIWDVGLREEIAFFPGDVGIDYAEWYDDENTIHYTGNGEIARLWTIDSILTPTEVVGEWFTSWNPQKPQLVTHDYNNAKQLLEHVRDPQTGRLLASLDATGPIDTWSQNGAYLTILNQGNSVQVWNTSSLAVVATLEGHSEQITDIAWSPNGQRLVTISKDDTARLWDTATGHQLGQLPGHTADLTSAAWSFDGQRLAMADVSGTIRIWNPSMDALLHTLVPEDTEQAKPVSSLAWSPDDQFLLATNTKDAERVWDVTTGKLLAELVINGSPVHFAAWNPTSAALVGESDKYEVALWQTGKWDAPLVIPGRLTFPRMQDAWSPDGKKFALGDNDGSIHIWNIANATEEKTLLGHTGAVYAVRWHPTGNILASISADGTIRIWDVQRSLAIAVLPSGDTGSSDIYWSYEGKYLADWHQSAGFSIHLVSTADLLTIACEHAPRNLSKVEWTQYFGDRVYQETCPGKLVPGRDYLLPVTEGGKG